MGLRRATVDMYRDSYRAVHMLRLSYVHLPLVTCLAFVPRIRRGLSTGMYVSH